MLIVGVLQSFLDSCDIDTCFANTANEKGTITVFIVENILDKAVKIRWYRVSEESKGKSCSFYNLKINDESYCVPNHRADGSKNGI